MSTRPLYLGALAVLVVVIAFALPPLSGVWRGAAEAGQQPTGDTTPTTAPSTTDAPTSSSAPPTSRPSTTQTPTSAPTTRAPVTVPAPTAAPTAPPTSAGSSTSSSETTATTVLPELLVPAQPPEAETDEGPPLPTTTTSLPEGADDGGGLLPSTKVWLSVAILAAIGLVLAALTVLYFLHTRPERQVYAYDADDLSDDAVAPGSPASSPADSPVDGPEREGEPVLTSPAGRAGGSGPDSSLLGDDARTAEQRRPMRAVLDDLLADDE